MAGVLSFKDVGHQQHTALSWVNQTTCVAYSKCNQKPFSFNLPTLGNTWSVAELVQVGPSWSQNLCSRRCRDRSLLQVLDLWWTSRPLRLRRWRWERGLRGGVVTVVSHGVTIFIFIPLQWNRYHLPSHSACTKSTGRWSKSFLQNYSKFLKHLWALQASSNTIREWL